MAQDSVCSATMLDMSRLPSLQRILNVWPGELSAAVLAGGLWHRATIQEQQDAVARVIGGHQSRVIITLVEDTG